ncbi:MAG: serine hydrolase domain-containing protein [Cyanobacteria bacterium P01_A01_bin.123]
MNKFLYILLFLSAIFVSVMVYKLSGVEHVSPNSLPSGANLDDVRTAVVTEIRQELDYQENAGMSGVVRLQWGDTVLIHEAYGWQDREAEQAMTLEVGFDIGSIVKLMTAATVLKLAENGRLQTADTIGQFFPDAPSTIRAIALDQLLVHTSGLPEYLGDDYELLNHEAALDRIFAARLRFAPGTREAYSNTGYTLLALVIEVASGLPYEQAVREAVLIPAGTPSIGYRLADWAQDDLAVGYRDQQRWGKPLDHAWLDDGPSWTLRGNGGMLATADDLARWFEAVFTGKILGREALSRFLDLFGISPDDYGLRIGEAGGNDIFNVLYEGWIDLGVNLTFLTSVSSHSAEQVWNEIRDEVYKLAQAAAIES